MNIKILDGCVTKLNAYRYDEYREGEMAFCVYSYNAFNFILNSGSIKEINFVKLI